MKNYFKISVASVAITAASFSVSNAQSTDWSGTYAGLTMNLLSPSFENNWDPDNSSFIGPVNDLQDPGLGYGISFSQYWQYTNRVYGVTAEYGLANLTNTTYYLQSSGLATNSERTELDISALGSIRGKAGFTVGDNAMVYATAGLAYVGAKFSAATSDTHPYSGSLDISSVSSVIGFGYERKVSDRISLDVSLSHYEGGGSKHLGGLGDGGTTDSAIDFGGVTTLGLGFKMKL